jgi:F-type H+-transporting ATPase subunit gamma
MGRYRNVELQLQQLDELRGIIASMKTLSQLELHKLGGLAEGQHRMSQTLEQVAADFLRFNPQPETGSGSTLWLLIGSERGFCGDFNESLIRRLLKESPECHEQPQRVLAVGRKLWLRMEENLPGFVPLVGASISEELPRALSQVVAETHEQLAQQQATALHLIYHSDEQGTIRSRRLLPPEISSETAARCAPPLLNLTPGAFFNEFLQHYLYLGLTELFSVSLLAENHHRVQHLEGAVRRLDDRLVTLTSRARSLRQEEITEEIETILLGTGAFTPVGRT